MIKLKRNWQISIRCSCQIFGPNESVDYETSRISWSPSLQVVTMATICFLNADYVALRRAFSFSKMSKRHQKDVQSVLVITPLSDQCQSSVRAVSEQFQSSSRVVPEQFGPSSTRFNQTGGLTETNSSEL